MNSYSDIEWETCKKLTCMFPATMEMRSMASTVDLMVACCWGDLVAHIWAFSAGTLTISLYSVLTMNVGYLAVLGLYF